MIRDFSREELEPVESSHTELTLGLGTVLGLGGGLLLLCGVCFALGYAVGHRSSTSQEAAAVFSDPKTVASPSSAGNKPGAVRQAPAAPSPDVIKSDPDSQAIPADSVKDSSPAQAAANAANAQVRPALQSNSSPDPALRVQPATSQVQGWMVQIAAVSRSEDADVLVTALRKRGYTVVERRELGDNLIHVQTGPFTNRNEANTMRQKLLNDGYNAIVQ
jgi:cell division septation protein DedD